MKSKFVKIFLIIFLIMPLGLIEAQFKSQLKEKPSVEKSIKIPNVGPSSSGFSLLDPNRFFMNQSYSLSYMSFGKSSTSLGIYQNRMSYIFSDKLTLNGHIGFIHNPLQMGINNNSMNPINNIIYGAELNYHPKENLFLNIRFDKVPLYYRYGMMPYGNRYYGSY
ncbi:MAG: hypothetical protein DRP89_03005 [Candidatus Neomarinimicrobiota bacterium]|nr:MAG: hypothetical protein DRP89_03005 [Candidatus Neomarinimicrobiota bacterium]